jgi:hypothetical protein
MKNVWVGISALHSWGFVFGVLPRIMRNVGSHILEEVSEVYIMVYGA